jgi:hypothetical protein
MQREEVTSVDGAGKKKEEEAEILVELCRRDAVFCHKPNLLGLSS